MNVTVDNFDELQLSQEEQAYFDHAYDPELIANYSSEVEPIHQIEENFKSLESEETFLMHGRKNKRNQWKTGN